MEMNEFQRQALQTAIYPQELRTIYPLIGITGETGEVAEMVSFRKAIDWRLLKNWGMSYGISLF